MKATIVPTSTTELSRAGASASGGDLPLYRLTTEARHPQAVRLEYLHFEPGDFHWLNEVELTALITALEQAREWVRANSAVARGQP